MMSNWHSAATTSLGLFWMAFWAFGIGYLISSMIQVFVTRERMRRTMGEAGPGSVALGSAFGFISSSCSFAALATTRSLFTKGAGLVPSLAFLLASTNLVVELGIVIAIFLGWQFVAGEYIGGILLILLMWLVVRITRPESLIRHARQRAKQQESDEPDQNSPNWKSLITSRDGWQQVANRYVMEWRMVWKDVTIGFTVAGIIAAYVPRSFFEGLFIGAGETDAGFGDVLLQTSVAPLAAFFTFIGSMGNIPLAAVLHTNGVSFAGVMAFIFSDLVVLPVVRIQARYYGWKMALYIVGVLLAVLVIAALLLHYGFAALGLLPEASAASSISQREFFAVDYTLALNVLFLLISVIFLVWKWRNSGFMNQSQELSERVLLGLSLLSFLWLAGGLVVPVAMT